MSQVVRTENRDEMKPAKPKKSTRGRRPGHLGKAHEKIRDEAFAQWQKLSENDRKIFSPEQIESWRHNELANRGNYPQEVERAAFILGKFTDAYDRALKSNRGYLEMNWKDIKIQMPYLPSGEHFEEGRIPQMLHETGHDILWAINFLGHVEAMRLLGYFVRAAVKKDVNFFRELARRVQSSIAMEVPLTAGAEPAYRALASLKIEYLKGSGGFGYALHAMRTLTPSLESVFRLPPGKRPPLTLEQLREYVWVYGHYKMSDRALSRAAKTIGIPVQGRGRRKNGT